MERTQIIIGTEGDSSTTMYGTDDVPPRSHPGHPTTVVVSFPKLRFSCDKDSTFDSQKTLKDWVWQTYQNEIYASMRVDLLVGSSTSKNDEDDDDYFSSDLYSHSTNTMTRTSSSRSSIVPEGMALTEMAADAEARKSRIIDFLEKEVLDRTLKLQETNTALENANRVIMEEAQRQLEHFACMSHEIRTPLNCIIGLANLLVLETSDLSPSHSEKIKMINSSGELLLTVVNDVLDYAKYEAGKTDFDITLTNLQDTLETIYRPMFTKAYSERNIIIRCFYDVNVPEFVHTDPRRLQQILFNVLGNAVKFSPDNGFVEFHVKVCQVGDYPKWCSPLCGKGEVNTPSSVMRDAVDGAVTTSQQHPGQRPPFEVSIPQSTNVLRIVIKNNGKGVKECDYERIFQPFLQSSDEKDNVHGGTGLGLPIAGELVKGLGGSIYVYSVEEEWAAFTIDFPFVDSFPDNADAVAKKMSNTTVFFVFNDYFPGSVAHFELCCRIYNVQERTFKDVDEMTAFVDREGSLDPNRTYICFFYEGQYQADAYASLAAKVKTVLLTFGPQRLVAEADGHYPCTNSILPTVLMDSLCTFVQEPQLNCTITEARDRNISLKDLKILVAEDNLVNQKVLRMMLNKIGLKDVDIVNNGQEAVDQEAQQEYDAILMDMQMPVMDGLDACKLIRKRYKNKKEGPKVAFVTAQVTSSLRAATVEAGAKAFLAKPFTMNGIQECLEGLLAPDASIFCSD